MKRRRPGGRFLGPAARCSPQGPSAPRQPPSGSTCAGPLLHRTAGIAPHPTAPRRGGDRRVPPRLPPPPHALSRSTRAPPFIPSGPSSFLRLRRSPRRRTHPRPAGFGTAPSRPPAAPAIGRHGEGPSPHRGLAVLTCYPQPPPSGASSAARRHRAAPPSPPSSAAAAPPPPPGRRSRPRRQPRLPRRSIGHAPRNSTSGLV